MCYLLNYASIARCEVITKYAHIIKSQVIITQCKTVYNFILWDKVKNEIFLGYLKRKFPEVALLTEVT